MPDIVVAFFLLGLLAGLLKSDLKVPQSIYETLSILLMLVLGVKGGLSLHGRTTDVELLDLVSISILGLIIPLALYPALRFLIKLNLANAVSIAAHYGSVSAGTFAVALAFAEEMGLPLQTETTLYLVLLELPAIIVMLWWHRRQAGGAGGQHVWREAFTSRSVFLLMGGILIGWAYGPEGLGSVHSVLIGGFQTFLALFLLEMGLCTARACMPLPVAQWRLLLFAAVVPFLLAALGLVVGAWLGLSSGSQLVLAALTASASYIAAPAAIRDAVPEADIGLAMVASLGITFPVNVLIGIPLYGSWIQGGL